jgi:molybdenum cofactor cytidylyltransferase
MTNFDDIAVILLAAGRSQRFGAAKLRANLAGRPLAHHAASRLAALPFRQHIAVVGSGSPDLSVFGFSQVQLSPVDAPLSRSIALGVAQARDGGSGSVMIALADMPLIPEAHFRALVAKYDGDRIATLGGEAIMPPAIFNATHYPKLMALEGDQGAGSLIKNAPVVELSPSLAFDVDKPDDLLRAEYMFET